MLKRLRAAHPILYCILAEVLFLGSLFLSSLVLTVALVVAGADFSGLDEYLLSLVQELVGAGAAWLLLRRTGRLGRRGSGFWNGLLVGMYPLAFICYSIYSALIFERPDTPLLPAGRILSFLACMAMVGVAEEFLFRGVIAETLLEHFGTSRCLESLPAVRRAVRRGPPDQPVQLGTLRRADAVRVLGVAGSAVCGHLFPHRQPLGHSIPARGHGHCLHAHRRAVRHHDPLRERERLRRLHAADRGGIPAARCVPAAEKEAAGGAAVLGSVHQKMRAAGKKILAICPAIWYTVSVTVVRGWEYARIPGKPFPAAVPLAHKIL